MLDEIDDTNFKEKTSRGTCLVLFYKDPCPFCKTMKGVIEKFAKKHGEVSILQIDGEKNPSSASQMGVERFPDVLFLKAGAQVGRQKGLCNPQTLDRIYGQI